MVSVDSCGTSSELFIILRRIGKRHSLKELFKMFSQGMWLGLWILCFRLTSDKKNSIQLDQSWQLLNSVDRHLLVVADPWCSRGKRSQRLITSLTINHIPDHVNLVRFNQAVREQMSQHKHCYINPVFNLTSKKNCMLREDFCQFNDELD